MSNERLASIEAKIDRVIEVQTEHTGTLAGHSAILAGHSAILAGHSTILADHTRRLDKLEAGQEVLRDSVAQIAEGHAAILLRLDRGFQSLHAVVHERLEPLEEAVRRLHAR